MKKQLLFIALLFTFLGYSQEDAWVYFNSKPNAQYFLDNPLEMLTQRSLDRRAAQNIVLDFTDVPIHVPFVNQIVASNGITVMAKSKWLNVVHVRGTQEKINALKLFPFVSKIVFANNLLNSAGKNTVPKVITPVNKIVTTETDFNYGNSSNQIQMLKGHLLHQQNYTGAGKIIAVLDSGFINVNTAQPFQRLFDNNLILGGYNYVSASTNVYSLHNHGTMVLSCMGGFASGQLIGTAPDANYYLFVTEDVTSENPVEESYWVEAAEEADRLGADIITSSLGYFEYDNPSYSHTYSQMTGNIAFASQGANSAFSKGIVVVASAGNSGNTSNPHVGVPAEATNVLAVGAVKFDETYATFSSVGPSFDGRVKPDVMAQGQSTVLSNTNGAIVTASGTSFSGPVMAGMIASFWQAVPEFTNQEIIAFIKEASHLYLNPTNQLGYGIPDFQLALTNALLALENKNRKTVEAYPNPVNDKVNFLLPESYINGTIYLFNELGQLVSEQKIATQSVTVSMQSHASGLYFYKVSGSEGNSIGKLIKQ